MTTFFSADIEPAQVVQAVLTVLDAYHSVQLQRLERIRFDLQTTLQANRLSSLEKRWLQTRSDHPDDRQALSAFTSGIIRELECSA